jgi:hypothetical protein
MLPLIALLMLVAIILPLLLPPCFSTQAKPAKPSPSRLTPIPSQNLPKLSCATTLADNTGIISIIDDDKPTQPPEDCFCDNLVRPNIDSIPGVDHSPNPVTAINSGSKGNDILIGTNANDQLNGFGGKD